jgi:hypothetical protein
MSETMSAKLESGVERRLESPTADKKVTLLVGVNDSHSESTIHQVEAAGANVEDSLPCDYLALSIKETDLRQLCGLGVVESMEIEGQGSTLGGTNL